MKTRLLSVLLAAFAALPVLRALPLDSKISAVTVYTDRAVVTRTATIDLAPGLSELVFADLPDSLNEQSLQVSGRGTATATILDVLARRTFADSTPNARVKAIEDQLRDLQKQGRGLDDRNAVLEAQSAMLSQMQAALFAPPGKEVPRPDMNQLTNALNYLTEQKTKLISAHATLDGDREELQAKIALAQAQLNELHGNGGRSTKTVTVRVSAAQEGMLAVSLSYTVPGAGWTPGYDARVLSGERAVSLGYFGLVHQTTGEDWKDVALTLSTAKPSLGGGAPTLPAWQLDVWAPQPVAYEARQMELDKVMNSRARKLVGSFVAQAASNAPAPAEGELKDADLAAAVIETAATSASFKIAVTASVPSDNSRQKVPITTARVAMTPEYLTVPKLQAVAYLNAHVANSTDFPLLAGAMNVFLDDTFVATSRLATVMPGEKFDLALGADEGISVKHRRVTKFTEDTGLTNSGKRITYEYVIVVQNNKSAAERVVVSDQLPVSRNEKITVRQLAPEVAQLKPTAEGTLQWTLDLKPGEKRELPIRFAVEYPNDVTVAGLD
jgi:uncharacterized protein (TIGR02231 family)